MTKDAKETDITHGKYREKIKESLKQSPEELQHLKNEQKRGTQKGVKRKGERKRRKTRKHSQSTGCCRRAFFTRRQLGIKEKYIVTEVTYIVNKHF